jgi:hypothetical protein
VSEPLLPAIPARRRTGLEPLHANGRPLPSTLLDFWQWSVSDLVSNATRGVLAEFVVATALGIDVTGVRSEWDPFDLTSGTGAKIEVKSAAYVQSWHQAKHSTISWRTPRTYLIDPLSNRQSAERRRQADVYVLALLEHKDKSTIDPLNVAQWAFFVLPTKSLDERTRSQHSITLPSLLALTGGPVTYSALAEAVESAWQTQRGAV